MDPQSCLTLDFGWYDYIKYFCMWCKVFMRVAVEEVAKTECLSSRYREHCFVI